MKPIKIRACLAALFVITGLSANAAVNITLDSYITGLTRPSTITYAPDSATRMYVCEKNLGRIRIINQSGTSGTLVATPFLDIGSLVSTGSEQGLLGLAFHPQYAANRRFFVYYTNTSGNIVIAEYQRNAVNPLIADATTTMILPIAHPTNTNHNGGTLLFGPDGYLYAGVGDGGGAGDVPGNAQNTNILLGKILRLDVSQTTTAYTIPPTNPFFGQSGKKQEIFCYGMRNPWRFNFDRGGAQRLFCGDVGQNLHEEVDIITVGGNYGWNIMEGVDCYNPSTGCNMSGLILPIATYDHLNGDCSITGGYVYRGASIPALVGKYVYADYCTGVIRMLTETSPGVFSSSDIFDAPFPISSFGEDASGELYCTDFQDTNSLTSGIYRFRDLSTASADLTSLMYE